MIVLKRLTWSNLFSYGANNSIDFTAQPITQLVGLNGHGKSSVPLILEEVLFNKNSKGIKKADIVNRNLNTNKYDASLEFSVYADEYTLSVNRSGATQKVKLVKNNEDISSHTATDTFKQVEAIIGLDFKTFSQIVYQNSSSSLQFLVATDSARKAFLIELLSLERYVEVFEQVKVIHKASQDAVTSAKAKIATISTWIETNKLKDLTTLSSVSVPQLDQEIVDQVTELKASLQTIEDTNKRIIKNNEYKKILESMDKTKLSEKVTAVDTSQLSKKLTIIKHNIDTETSKIKKFEGVTTGECPTCYQPVNTDIISKLIAESKDLIASGKLEYNELLKEFNRLKENNEKAVEYDTVVANFEKFSNLIDATLPDLVLDKEDIKSRLAELSSQLTDLQSRINAANDHNHKAAIHNAKVDSIKEQTSKFIEELDTLTTGMQTLEESFGLLEVLKKAFSTTGLLAYKIETSVKDLEVLTNEYLEELSDGRFQLEFILDKDKLKVSIIDNGATIEISALSAGELARVTTSTLLAIRKLMSSLSKCRLNILFLDETIDNLDTFGKEKLVEVLLNEKFLNTFLISHGYSHPLIEKITVVKEDGISRLET